MGTALPQRVTFAVGWKGPDALQAHTHPSHRKYTLLMYRVAQKQAQDVFFICLFVFYLFLFLTDPWEEPSVPMWVWPAVCPAQTRVP